MKKFLALIITMLFLFVASTVAFADTVVVCLSDPKSTLNGRFKASLDSSVEYNIPNGEEVELISIADGWALVKYSEEVYCSVDYLLTERYEEPKEAIIVSNGRVKLRKSITDDAVVKWLKNGSRIKVLGYITYDGTTWYKTKSGYVDGDYVSMDQ